MADRSTARVRPTREMSRAEVFIIIGIVKICVLTGKMLFKIKNPPIILPMANRLMGFKISLLFSLIVDIDKKRG